MYRVYAGLEISDAVHLLQHLSQQQLHAQQAAQQKQPGHCHSYADDSTTASASAHTLRAPSGSICAAVHIPADIHAPHA